MRRARARYTLLPALAAALLLLFTSGQATAATALYSGTGWRAWTDNSIVSLSPDPYEVVFADDTARTQLAPYLKMPAAQVTNAVGVTITVTDTLDTTPVDACPPRHRIVVHYLYRPAGTAGMSQTYACHAIADGSAWGGHLLIDSEYWTVPGWFSSDPTVNTARQRDAVTHELGHALGLAHPNQDLNGDGTVAAGECVQTSTGLKPIMCSPNRGNPLPTVTSDSTGRTAYSVEAGKFSTAFDVPGLKQLLANYSAG
ncbi:hypothetical protein ACF061_00535 [Streptomyces sp. NPDC015220]|uniref:hypothetical protein n=1 Tax=Streptomyces sp. NPDC015220 TaxID=3364947 RepID=UPI0036F82671